MSNFVLRKLVVDKDCGKKLKILEPGEYTFTDAKYDDFFMEGVAIHAIVGKNGSGKSSLVEMLFRMSNNLAALMLRGYDRPASDTIYFIREVVAQLYYEIDGKYGCLICDENSVEISLDDERFCWSLDNDNCIHYRNGVIVTDETRHIMEMQAATAFFYTVATNYSVQSYIAGDFASEALFEWKEDETTKGEKKWLMSGLGEAWINSVFHKNDGYMCPIVLNPYRNNGKIDMEAEERLTTNRLSAILWETQLDESHAQLIEGYRLYNLNYSFRVSILINKFTPKVLDAIDDKSFTGKFIKVYNQPGSFAKAVLDAYGYGVSPKMSTVECCLRVYLVYKTFRIAENYPTYNHFSWVGDRDNTFKTTNERNLLDYATKLVETIKEDTSHITLKIRQTRYVIEEMVKLNDESKQLFELPISYGTYCQLLGIPLMMRSIEERLAVLPPPFLKPDIWLVKSEDYDKYIVENKDRQSKLNRLAGKAIHINHLSSGERQFIFMTTTLVYHSLNLKSIPEKKRIAYKNICMVLDEVEICFHPEYQRTFISKLLGLLKRTGLSNCFGIDILIVTHSPFVLSDIPKENILYLEDGKDAKYKMRISTFASNINELLAESFFLNGGFVGEFASQVINDLANFLLDKQHERRWDMSSADQMIEAVGDDVVKIQLRKLFVRKFGKENQAYKSWVQKEFKRLGLNQENR